jgi:hypothetical protein
MPQMGETKDNPPPITNPVERAGHELERGFPFLWKRAWKTVVSLIFVSGLLGFCLAWFLVVASKNATIETLTTATKEKDVKIDQLQKQDETLQKQNLELKTALAEFTAPLKKRTLILARQLKEFAQQYKPVEPEWATQLRIQQEYEARFESRLHRTIDQLDEVGQHSIALDSTRNIVLQANPFFITNITAAAKELEQLANNLKE